MKRILIAGTALTLIAYPAQAQVAGVDVGGAVGGALGVDIGGAVSGAASGALGGDVGGTVSGALGSGGAAVGGSADGTIVSGITGTGGNNVPVGVVYSNFESSAHARSAARAERHSARAEASGNANLTAGLASRLAVPAGTNCGSNAGGCGSGGGSGSHGSGAASLLGTATSTVGTAAGLAQGATNCASPCSGGNSPNGSRPASLVGTALSTAGQAGGIATAGSIAGTAQGAAGATATFASNPLHIAGSMASLARVGFVIDRGTPIFAPEGDRIGRVQTVMVDVAGTIGQLLVKVDGRLALIPANYFYVSPTGLLCVIGEDGLVRIAEQQALVGGSIGGQASATVQALRGSGTPAGSASFVAGTLAVAGSLAAQVQGAVAVERGVPIFDPHGARIGNVDQLMIDADGYIHQVLVKVGRKEAMLPVDYFQPNGDGLICIIGEDSIAQIADQQRAAKPHAAERG